MTEQDTNLVPGKQHYAARYVRGGRLFSYAHQMNAVLEHEPRTVLEIGPGPGMVTAAFRAIGIDVTTVDVQPQLEPDVVASVTDLPFEHDSFDVSMCCQVLEHLPFDQFEPALKELGRVSRKAVLISLPDARSYWEVSGRLPGMKRFAFKVSRQHAIQPERIQRSWLRSGHYWEIGHPEYPIGKIMSAFKQPELAVKRTWRPSEMAYHWFVELAPLAVEHA